MSQENVEIVRRSIEAWNRRDLTTLSPLWRSDGEIDWSQARGPLKGALERGAGVLRDAIAQQADRRDPGRVYSSRMRSIAWSSSDSSRS
jgi:ketosteroid isomerase-like protein